MSKKLQQLQKQISELADDDFEALYAWFDEQQMERWGIEDDDAGGGSFGALAEEVMSAFQAMESLEITQAAFDDTLLWVGLSDGRSLGVPLAWYPRLLNAEPEQRQNAQIGPVSLTWQELDLEISLTDLLTGRASEE